MVSSRFRRGAVIFGAAAFFLGCADEDRVLTARCQLAGDGFAAVAFLPLDPPDALIGGFNARQDALGTLFKYVPDEIGSARWAVAYTLVTHAIDVSPEFYWNSQSLQIRLKTDLDGEELAEPSRASIESVLLSGSGLVAWDVEREAIKDVMRLINEDHKALSILQEAAAEDRYLVISSRLLAKQVGLFYTPGGGIWLSDGQGSVSTPFIAISTFRIGSTNFHTNFSCEPIDRLNATAVLVQSRVPAIYFYTAVRYDPTTKRVERDPRVTDIDLLTATLRPAQTRQLEK